MPVTKEQRTRGLKTLNYPNSTATRHSKKFVTNMKKLEVRLLMRFACCTAADDAA